MLPTTMPLKQTTANTKKTKKTLNGNHQSYLKYTTTAWICQTYAPVFQSIARLKNLATCLLDKMSILLNKHNMDTSRNPTHPITSTPNQQPLHPPYNSSNHNNSAASCFPLFHCQPPSTTVAISLKPNAAWLQTYSRA